MRRSQKLPRWTFDSGNNVRSAGRVGALDTDNTSIGWFRLVKPSAAVGSMQMLGDLGYENLSHTGNLCKPASPHVRDRELHHRSDRHDPRLEGPLSGAFWCEEVETCGPFRGTKREDWRCRLQISILIKLVKCVRSATARSLHPRNHLYTNQGKRELHTHLGTIW